MIAHNFNVNFNKSSNLYSFESILSSMFLKCRNFATMDNQRVKKTFVAINLD